MSETQRKVISNENFLESLSTNSSTQKIVIACPSCQTKFSISIDIVANLSSPRFHCSRCENIFSFEIEEHAPIERTHSFRQLPVRPEKIAESGSVLKRFQIPESSLKNSAITEPRENLTESETIADANALEERSSWALGKNNQLEFNFQKEAGRIYTPAFEENNLRKSFLKNLFGNFFSSNQKSVDKSYPIKKIKISSYSPWKDLTWLVSPLIACLVLLFALAMIFSKYPNLVDKLSPFKKSKIYAAYPGIFLNRLKSKRVVLDNGDVVHIISGRLINGSNKTIRSLSLQAIGFDSNGSPVYAVETKLNTALLNSKTKSLTPEIIKDVQATTTSFSIKPGEKQDFAIGLLKSFENKVGTSEKTDLSYFSARIYSLQVL